MRSRISPALRLLVLVLGVAWTGWFAWNNLLHWLAYGQHDLGHTDFALYYAFSRIGLLHGWGNLYDLNAQRDVYRSMPGTWWFPLPYAPPMAWLTAPFTALPLAPAYWVWSGVLAAAFVACWWLATPSDPMLRVICLTAGLSPYLSLLGLELGQVVVLQLLAVAGAVRLLTGNRPVLAGLSLVLLDIHPQSFYLVPVALLLFGARRAVLSWAAASAVLIAVAGATLGLHGVEQYFHRLVLAVRSPVEFYVSFPVDLPLMIHNRWLRVAVMTVLASLALFTAWRERNNRIEIALAAGLIGSVLVTPFIHLDDLMVLVLAGWLTLRRRLAPAYSWLLAAGAAVAVLLDVDRLRHYGWLIVAFEVVWLVTLAALPPFRRLRTTRPEPSVVLAGLPGKYAGAPQYQDTSLRSDPTTATDTWVNR